MPPLTNFCICMYKYSSPKIQLPGFIVYLSLSLCPSLSLLTKILLFYE